MNDMTKALDSALDRIFAEPSEVRKSKARDDDARRWDAFARNFSGYSIEFDNGLIKYENDKYLARRYVGSGCNESMECDTLNQAIDWMFDL